LVDKISVQLNLILFHHYLILSTAHNEKDLQSITSINILKRDSGNDTEIGKSVKFKIIDLTNKKKVKAIFKDAI